VKYREQVGKAFIELNLNITLWQAIKLRIAGRSYEAVVAKVASALSLRLQIADMQSEGTEG